MEANQGSKDTVNAPSIHVESHKVDTGETQLVVIGEIDLATSSVVDSALSKLKGRVVLDLRRVEFMDSTGIRLILTHLERLNASGGHLRIVADSGPVLKLIQIAGLADILDISDTLRPQTPESEVV